MGMWCTSAPYFLPKVAVMKNVMAMENGPCIDELRSYVNSPEGKSLIVTTGLTQHCTLTLNLQHIASW